MSYSLKSNHQRVRVTQSWEPPRPTGHPTWWVSAAHCENLEYVPLFTWVPPELWRWSKERNTLSEGKNWIKVNLNLWVKQVLKWLFLFGSSREDGLLAASQSKLFVDLGSRRPSLPLGVVGQCYYWERAKHPLAAGRELAWHSQLSLGVLLLNRNNFMEYHPQTRPLCKQQWPKNPPNQKTNQQKTKHPQPLCYHVWTQSKIHSPNHKNNQASTSLIHVSDHFFSH